MKQIIFALTFIYFVFCQGPAYNVEDRDKGSCTTNFVKAGQFSTSTCVDRSLYYEGNGDRSLYSEGNGDRSLYSKENGYYDKCCYIRFRERGEMLEGCIGLTREHYIDVVQTIENIEKGYTNLLYGMEDPKIYELNCNSSYLKLFALSFALISLLF